jgi:hypothetical protein
VDELQKFQPGFELDWRLNLELKSKRAAIAPSLPPLQPDPGAALHNVWNRAQDDEPLIRPPRERRRKHKLGDGHECSYDRYAADGRCVLCLEEHNFCCLLNERSRCDVCHRVAEHCPEDESKSFHLIERLLDLHRSQHHRLAGSTNEMSVGGMARPLKVIVFSQFRSSLNIVGDRLLRRFGTACIAEYFGSHRKQELNKFTNHPGCFCLLLTKDGSEGLDLSFVTNIVFFEEIYDQALQDQSVARAWRMGAKGQVDVETLIARHSLEEVLGERYDKDEVEVRSGSSGGEQLRVKLLLQSLRYITDYHHFASPRTTSAREQKAPSQIADQRLKRTISIPAHDADASQPSKRAKPEARVSFANEAIEI